MNNSNRIATLIDKLKEQYTQGVPHTYLLVTTQMLLSELSNASNASGAEFGSAIVSNPFVVHTPQQNSNQADIFSNDEPELTNQTTQNSRFTIPKLDLPEIPFLRQQSEVKVFDESPIMPKVEESNKETLAISSLIPDENAELHEKLHINAEHDFNEKLKEEKVELASILNAAPLTDLRNAVGINDRFLFIQELFNADETMYERCIKTINSFTTFGEAESWIQRELKVKLGWKENSETVVHFDQLVKRRFS